MSMAARWDDAVGALYVLGSDRLVESTVSLDDLVNVDISADGAVVGVEVLVGRDGPNPMRELSVMRMRSASLVTEIDRLWDETARQARASDALANTNQRLMSELAQATKELNEARVLLAPDRARDALVRAAYKRLYPDLAWAEASQFGIVEATSLADKGQWALDAIIGDVE